MVLGNIKEYTKELKEQFKERIGNFEEPPTLLIIQVGNVESSNRYIRNKMKDCDEVGITAHLYQYPEDITEKELCEVIKLDQEFYDGVIVQLPLPPHIREKTVIAAIDPMKDVDGFHVDSPYPPATPGGIMMYLKHCNFDLVGKDVVIIGRSNIVGKPLAAMMTAADATVTLCHGKSKLSHHLYSADLIVTAVGKPYFLNCYPIHVPVIDVGINFDENGKLVGDCFNTEGRDVTPVPGGVGLLTRCALLDNVIEAKARKCLKRG